jgi:hypothetical protein
LIQVLGKYSIKILSPKVTKKIPEMQEGKPLIKNQEFSPIFQGFSLGLKEWEN